MFDTASRAAKLGVQHISVYPYRPSPGTRMASHIDSGRREPLKLEYMKSSYSCARETLEKNGFDQYALSYFAKSEEYRSKVSMHIYNLEGDVIGFGSGGHSILGWHRVLNDNAFYDRYIDDPLSFDKCVKFGTEPDQIESLLLRVGAALQTQGGLNFRRFESLTGHDFQKLRRENDATIGFLRHLRLCGARFVEFDDRLVLESENVHDVYLEHISMLVKYGKLDRGLRV
jgi:oxygen-independent coproporphyrinogen-3 oxidase